MSAETIVRAVCWSAIVFWWIMPVWSWQCIMVNLVVELLSRFDMPSELESKLF